MSQSRDNQLPPGYPLGRYPARTYTAASNPPTSEGVGSVRPPTTASRTLPVPQSTARYPYAWVQASGPLISPAQYQRSVMPSSLPPLGSLLQTPSQRSLPGATTSAAPTPTAPTLGSVDPRARQRPMIVPPTTYGYAQSSGLSPRTPGQPPTQAYSRASDHRPDRQYSNTVPSSQEIPPSGSQTGAEWTHRLYTPSAPPPSGNSTPTSAPSGSFSGTPLPPFDPPSNRHSFKARPSPPPKPPRPQKPPPRPKKPRSRFNSKNKPAATCTNCSTDADDACTCNAVDTLLHDEACCNCAGTSRASSCRFSRK